jgi:hypothetical protein
MCCDAGRAVQYAEAPLLLAVTPAAQDNAASLWVVWYALDGLQGALVAAEPCLGALQSDFGASSVEVEQQLPQACLLMPAHFPHLLCGG